MAKIPRGEGFGEVTARSGNLTMSGAAGSEAAYGGALAQSVEGVGAQMVDQERREAAILERQAKATREAANRTKAAVELQNMETDLDIIGDEVAAGIQDGTIDKTAANDEFKRRTQERIAAGMPNIPPEHATLAQSSATNRAARLGRSVGKAVLQRDQQDVRSGLQSQLEYAQRLYVKDPAAADQMVSETIEALGPFSGLNAAELQKAHQGWRESTRLNKAQTLVNEAKRDNKALDKVAASLNSDEFADIDPQRKTTLLGQIEGFQVSNIQRAEAEARRRQAEQERYLRKAEAEFNAAQSLVTQGKVLSPEYIDRVTKAVQGTPYAAALKESMRQGPENTAFGVQPLNVQQATLDAARADLLRTGTNPKAEEKLGALQKVHDAAVRDYKEEPLRAALERGVIQQIEPVDTSSVQNLVATMARRVDQASMTRQQVGTPVSPLLNQEAEKVGQMINNLPVEQRATAIAQLAQVAGPEQAGALARQIAPKDKALGIALGMAGSMTTQGRHTSEIVLRGAQAMKDKAVKADNAAVTGIRARVAQVIGDAYPSEEVREAMIDAAVFAEYGLQSEGSGDLSRAVRLVTGGGIVERGGRKVPLPQGMTSSQFDERLRTLTPKDLRSDTVVVGGQTIPAKDFISKIPDAPLIVRGNGRYAVQAGNGLVMRPDGKPLIVEVR
ncbi:hypothetical protein [Hydrogenophaga sp.]|uniref:hypothetical protein n=1 Tax=Hydrogenophaga sp. TaxID=1904254 RepID=UPI003F6F4194